MKRIFLLVVGVVISFGLLVPAQSRAEFEDNPDRFTSVGLSLGLTQLSGDRELQCSVCLSIPGSVSQDLDMKTQDLSLDLRAPVSGSWTLFGSLSYIMMVTDSPEKDLGVAVLLGEEVDIKGFGFRIGARHYFNHRPGIN